MSGLFAEVLGDEPAPWSFVWGEGPLPAELSRLNLAAFVYPGLWCLLTGLYEWWLLFFARYWLWVSVTRTVFPLPRRPRSWIALPVTLSEPGRWALYLGLLAADLGLDLWFGMNADRLLWRAGPRLRARAGSRGKLRNNDLGVLGKYEAAQQGCARNTAGLFLVGLAMLALGAFTSQPRDALSWTGATLTEIAVGAAVLWWWLDRRAATR